MSEVKNVVWTNEAKNQLKTIFNFYKEKSVQGANNLKDDILKTTKNIRFSEQYQKDEIESEYRRIVVRDYKILYREENGVVYIVRVFSNKRDPISQI
ncbi:type II toxin-antitoxin system RelE/ParE family toxin [Flavobacterium sp. LBUM151]